MARRPSARSMSSVVLVVLLGGVLVTQALQAVATHEPANKAAASSVSLVDFDRSAVLLRETMRVSSTQDVILNLAAECSILTELTTGGGGLAEDSAEAFGQVNMNITIDGRPVPISTFDQDPATPGTQNDDGTVTFCEREDRRTVRDAESPEDGTDETYTYQRTKQANAWQWLALDVGKNYDAPANGNNIVDIVVHGYYATSEVGRAVADAYVGQRVLIAEPTHASVHEQILPVDENA